MHRSIDIAVPADATEALVSQLTDLDGVVTLAVNHGDSVVPLGDVISLTVLNTDADAVLSLVNALPGDAAVVTSTVDSLLYRPDQEAINADHDESNGEESETALRRHSRPNLNYALTSAAGAVLPVCAFTSSSDTTQSVALVAAGIIAPAFEPLARIALGLSTRHRFSIVRGLRSALFGYAIMIATAIVMMLLLRLGGGHSYVEDVLRNRTWHEVQHPPAITLLLSAAGAVAGIVMVASGRFTSLPGALVALQLLPALVATGIALELGKFNMALRSFGRFGIDVGMVLLAGLIYFTYKQIAVHSRRPVMH